MAFSLNTTHGFSEVPSKHEDAVVALLRDHVLEVDTEIMGEDELDDFVAFCNKHGIESFCDANIGEMDVDDL